MGTVNEDLVQRLRQILQSSGPLPSGPLPSAPLPSGLHNPLNPHYSPEPVKLNTLLCAALLLTGLGIGIGIAVIYTKMERDRNKV